MTEVEPAPAKRTLIVHPRGRKILRVAGILFAIVILYWAGGVRLYLFPGVSMAPAVNPGDYLLALVGPWRLRPPNRFDRIIFDVPSTSKWAGQKIPWMKRVVGLPREHVRLAGNELQIDGRKVNAPFLHSVKPGAVAAVVDVTLGADQYFVLGDNLDHSFDDSRTMGAIDRALIRGFVAGVIRIP